MCARRGVRGRDILCNTTVGNTSFDALNYYMQASTLINTVCNSAGTPLHRPGILVSICHPLRSAHEAAYWRAVSNFGPQLPLPLPQLVQLLPLPLPRPRPPCPILRATRILARPRCPGRARAKVRAHWSSSKYSKTLMTSLQATPRDRTIAECCATCITYALSSLPVIGQMVSGWMFPRLRLRLRLDIPNAFIRQPC